MSDYNNVYYVCCKFSDLGLNFDKTNKNTFYTNTMNFIKIIKKKTLLKYGNL